MMQLSSFGSFDKLEWLWYTYFLGGFPMSYMYSNVFANKEKLHIVLFCQTIMVHV